MIPNQAAISDAFQAKIADPDSVYLVGDNLAPEDGGWSRGQPGSGIFVPYVVVMTGSVRATNPQTSLGEIHFMAGLELRHFAGSLAQLKAISQKVRELADGKWGELISGYKAIHVHARTFGGYQRVDTTDPPMWQAYDAFEVELFEG